MIKSSTTKKGMLSVFHRTDNIDLKPFTIIIISFWISPSQSWAHETYFGSLFLTASSSPPSRTQSGYLETWVETNKYTCLPFDNLTIRVSTHRHFKVQISHWTLWKSCRAEENLSTYCILYTCCIYCKHIAYVGHILYIWAEFNCQDNSRSKITLMPNKEELWWAFQQWSPSPPV